MQNRTPAARFDPSWRRAWLTALAIWGVAEIGYVMVNALYWMATWRAAPPLVELLNAWSHWDTGHYLTIAEEGYDPNGVNRAFFPPYSMLMRFLDPVLPGHALAAGLVISSAACIVTLAFLHRLVEDLFGVDTAQRAVLYLMASPLAFFLVAVFNESLFIAFCAASLYFMHRSRWWTAGALAGFASGTRYVGVILGLAFVVEYLRQRDWSWRAVRADALAILLVPSGLLAYMIYSAVTWGDPLLFAHLQQNAWGHQLSLPWRGTIETLDLYVTSSATTPLDGTAMLYLIDLLTVLVLAGVLVLSMVGPWRLGPPSWYLIAFGGTVFVGVLMSPMLTGIPPLHGLDRYALEMLAIYVVLARIGADRRFDRAYLYLSVMLQTTLLVAFFGGVFVS